MRKLLRLKEVSELTGISRSRILRLVSEGKFVKPTHADLPIMTAWVSSDIEEWIEKQIEKGRGQEPPLPNKKPRFRRGFFMKIMGQTMGQNDLIKSDLIRFGLKGIQQPRQKRYVY